MATAATLPEEFVESCNPVGCTDCSRLGHYCASRALTITCAELVAADGFDATDRPVAGTACVGCRHLGHYCPAKGMCGEQPLCLACGTGETCDQVLSIERMHAGLGEYDEFEAERAPAECRTIAIADADRVVLEVAPVTAWAIKASLDPENLKRTGIRKTNLRWSNGSPKPKRVRVVKEAKPKKLAAPKKQKPEEVVMAEKMELEAAKVKALEMASVSLKINPIAKVVGWSWGEVREWLREAGMLPATGSTVKGKGTVAKKKKKPAASKKGATPPIAEKPDTVGIRLTERSLDAFWAQCSLAEKALAFSAVLEGR
jgi:hypothetical protein